MSVAPQYPETPPTGSVETIAPGRKVATRTRFVRVPAGINGDVVVLKGSRLLASALDRPGIAAHRGRWHPPLRRTTADLIEMTRAGRLAGRGGAAFPLTRKIAAVADAGRDPIVVINAAEGEPGSAKDSALLLTAAHLVLDGATIAADALGADEIHLVVPSERPAVVAAARAAADQHDHVIPITVTQTTSGFVAGQASAVIELLSGRENLPVTTWRPPAESGLRGRPTLLSNAETFAQLAVLSAVGPQAFSRVGTPDQPGTVLLTVAGDGPHGVVLEVPYGVPLADVLEHIGHDAQAPVVIGGYHGVWLSPQDVATRRLSAADLGEVGASLGAGVILPVPRQACPVELTTDVVDYLAGQSARRCGPCRNGLPALADAMVALANGEGVTPEGIPVFTRIEELVGLLPGRGACAHPDGTVRLVRSLLRTYPDEVASHLVGECSYLQTAAAAAMAAGPVEPAPTGLRIDPLPAAPVVGRMPASAIRVSPSSDGNEFSPPSGWRPRGPGEGRR